MKEKRKSKSKHDEHFERIDATPEERARAIFRVSPKDLKEWQDRKKENSAE